MKDYKNYLYHVYSGWLGKNIGIRLGAPVEGWDYTKIRKWYGHYDHYYVDYGIFAADDDSNGPLFFVRPLLEKKDINEKDIGEAFLKYIREYKGFFWWGGVGVSSEHTAYENLKNGIMPPLSGSAKTNGGAIANQIGGQIFSDCWGYVSLGNPNRAKKLAQMASSVTHDQNGIEGGVFVAVSIALAYICKDIYEVLDKALEYLDKDKEYYKVLVDVKNYYINHDDFEDCFKYIRDKYGYDKYPGVCHIIPNAALMMAGMLYGKGDFEKTLLLINNGGWDTDCNCGNVGSILGVLNGVDKIDKKWITPINDILNCSSAVGSLNITTISETTKMFTKIAYKLEDKEINDETHFDLPYASEGFIGDIKVRDGYLKCDGEIFKYVYYKSRDLYDRRYDPAFCPIVYPGDEIIIDADKDVEVFVIDCDGIKQTGINKLTILNGVNKVINKIGFSGKDYKFKSYKIIHHPKLNYEFKSLSVDNYGNLFGMNENGYNIRSFCDIKGEWIIDDGLKGKGLITVGNLNSSYSFLKTSYKKIKGDCYFVYNFKNAREFSRIGLNDGYLEIYKNEKLIQKSKIKDSVEIDLELFEDRIMINNQEIIKDSEKITGLVGYYTDDDGEILVKNLES